MSHRLDFAIVDLIFFDQIYQKDFLPQKIYGRKHRVLEFAVITLKQILEANDR